MILHPPCTDVHQYYIIIIIKIVLTVFYCFAWRDVTFVSFVCNLSTGIRAYEQLGYRAFGNPGKMAAGIAITLQNIGGEEPM